jgi:DNA-binding response OmpR family regulator
LAGPQDVEILVVDDHESMRTILAVMLRAFGFVRIREAENGEDALRVLEDYAPDIIVTDLKMDPLDGIGFVRRLRARPDRKAMTPVIMVTGHATPFRVVAARDAGVNEFIAKPVNGRMLAERLTRIVEEDRPFIRCATYVGPCRRRRTTKDYGGPFRRKSDAQAKRG